jgi:hypothetical protein
MSKERVRSYNGHNEIRCKPSRNPTGSPHMTITCYVQHLATPGSSVKYPNHKITTY